MPYRALGSRKGFVACEEAEALCFFPQKHRAKIAVPEPNIAGVCDRTGYAERLQANPDIFGGFSGILRAFLYRDCSAGSVCQTALSKAMG